MTDCTCAVPDAARGRVHTVEVTIQGQSLPLVDGYAMVGDSRYDDGSLVEALDLVFTDYPNPLGVAQAGAVKDQSRSLRLQMPLLLRSKAGQPHFAPGSYGASDGIQPVFKSVSVAAACNMFPQRIACCGQSPVGPLTLTAVRLGTAGSPGLIEGSIDTSCGGCPGAGTDRVALSFSLPLVAMPLQLVKPVCTRSCLP